MWFLADNSEKANLIERFKKSNTFIERALAGKGKVLIHSLDGNSRYRILSLYT